MAKPDETGIEQEIGKLLENYNAAVDAAVDGTNRSISYLMELHGTEKVKKAFSMLIGNPEGDSRYFGNWESAVSAAETILSGRRKARAGSPSGRPFLKKIKP